MSEVGLSIGTVVRAMLLLAILVPVYACARATGPSAARWLTWVRDQIPKAVATAVMVVGIISTATTDYPCLFRIGGVMLSYVISSALDLVI